jgi:hypothetical protein
MTFWHHIDNVEPAAFARSTLCPQGTGLSRAGERHGGGSADPLASSQALLHFTCDSLAGQCVMARPSLSWRALIAGRGRPQEIHEVGLKNDAIGGPRRPVSRGVKAELFALLCADCASLKELVGCWLRATAVSHGVVSSRASLHFKRPAVIPPLAPIGASLGQIANVAAYLIFLHPNDNPLTFSLPTAWASIHHSTATRQPSTAPWLGTRRQRHQAHSRKW